MSYGGHPYGGVAYAGSDVADIPADTETTVAVEVSFTTGPLETPVWVDITEDCRFWSTSRGRQRELERFQPGRATVVLSNLSRQYDSLHTANIKPMKRIRIRETFSGVTYPVFDGYVDKWQLDYPGKNKDATATVTATDGFKVFARYELPPSVYADEVLSDAPAIWWRMNDPQYLFSAVDSSGNGNTGAPAGAVRFGGETLIVNDPGSSLQLEEFGDTNVEASYSLNIAGEFGFEFWFKWDDSPTGSANLVNFTSGGSASVQFQVNPATAKGGFIYTNNAAGAFSAQPNFVFVIGRRYHIFCTHKADRKLRVFIDGAETGYDVQDTTTGAADITLVAVGSSISTAANKALLDEFSLYTTVLSDTRIGVHRGTGVAPWENDFPDTRAGRILDEAGWPAALRELDAGITNFQSASLNTPALEQLQKISESEYASLMFMTRDGKVRFRGRTSVLAREPYPVAFGMDAAEVGYTGFVPDDGDDSIRNRASISRLDGPVRTAQDATSITAFGRFDYALDGLMNSSDTDSANHAFFVVDQYADQRRRIASLDLGPPIVGEESVVYPAMLGPELGDAITVRNEPPGGGTAFSQVCAVEGIEHSGAPAGARTCRFILSPEYPIRTLEDQDVATLGYAQVTADQVSISALVDLTNLSVAVTVGSSRRVKITAQARVNNDGTAGTVLGYIRESTTVLNLFAANSVIASGFTLAKGECVLTPSAGAHTYKLSMEKAGAGTFTVDADATFPPFILVEDVGPV